MAMDKQTKQLIALGGLVVVAGIVAYFFYFRGDDEATKNPPKNATKPADPVTTPTPNSGTAQPGATTTPTTPGGTPPVVVDQDLEIPEDENIRIPEVTWKYENGGRNFVPQPERNILAAFDPFLVQNIDVVDPQRREYIESLKQEWILDGIIETKQELAVFGPDGKALIGNSITAPKPLTEPVVKKDANGKPVKDKDGKYVIEDQPVMKDGQPVYEQAVDENGQPVVDKDGKPVYVQDILYVRVDPDGKPLLDKDGKSVLAEDGKPLPDGGKPKVDKDGKPIIVRNPGPNERVKRLIQQVPLMIKQLVVDEKGVPVLDENGKLKFKLVPELDPVTKKPVMVDDDTPQFEVKLVLEATFQDKRRPYKEKDRLTGTRFTILKIFQKRPYWNENKTDVKVRAGVDLISDTGAPLTIFVTDDDRYTIEVTDAPKGK
jgi:hypothetical protein